MLSVQFLPLSSHLEFLPGLPLLMDSNLEPNKPVPQFSLGHSPYHSNRNRKQTKKGLEQLFCVSSLFFFPIVVSQLSFAMSSEVYFLLSTFCVCGVGVNGPIF